MTSRPRSCRRSIGSADCSTVSPGFMRSRSRRWPRLLKSRRPPIRRSTHPANMPTPLRRPNWPAQPASRRRPRWPRLAGTGRTPSRGLPRQRRVSTRRAERRSGHLADVQREAEIGATSAPSDPRLMRHRPSALRPAAVRCRLPATSRSPSTRTCTFPNRVHRTACPFPFGRS